MKLFFCLCASAITLTVAAETNQVYLGKVEVAGKAYTNCTVKLLNPVQAIISYEGGGTMVSVSNLSPNVLTKINYDPIAAENYIDDQEQKRQAQAKARAERVAEIEQAKQEREWNMHATEIKGKVDSISGNMLIVNATKDRFIRTGSSLTASQRAGAFAGYGGPTGYTVEEFDRQVAITNFTGISTAAVGQKISIRAMRAGVFKQVNEQPIELWDCKH